jgi:hypothetical protein
VFPIPPELDRMVKVADRAGLDVHDEIVYLVRASAGEIPDWIFNGSFYSLVELKDTMKAWEAKMPEILDKAKGMVVYYKWTEPEPEAPSYRVFFGPVDETIDKIQARIILAR